MSLKLIKLLLSIILITSPASLTFKQDLLQRAIQLKARVENEIKKLENQNRDYLSTILREEEQRLDELVDELKNSPDIVRTAIIESELISMEYRLEKEVNVLENQSTTQDLLLACAQTLREWTAQMITDLRPFANKGNIRAQVIIFTLISEEQDIDRIAQQLQTVQTLLQIQTLEVELRAVEIRLYEALMALHFKPYPTYPPITDSTTTSATTITEPQTSSPTQTRTESTTLSTTISVGTSAGSTETTIDDNIETTISPTELLKAELIKRTHELEEYAKYEINKLCKNNITIQDLEDLEKKVEAIELKLQHIDSTQILSLLESELYWLEKRLAIEVEALVAQDKRTEKLLAIAIALRERLDSDIDLLGPNTAIGQALKEETDNLNKLSRDLKRATDDKTIDNLELRLRAIDNTVNDQLAIIENGAIR